MAVNSVPLSSVSAPGMFSTAPAQQVGTQSFGPTAPAQPYVPPTSTAPAQPYAGNPYGLSTAPLKPFTSPAVMMPYAPNGVFRDASAAQTAVIPPLTLRTAPQMSFPTSAYGAVAGDSRPY